MNLKGKLLVATSATVLAVLGAAEWLSYTQTASVLRNHEALMRQEMPAPALLESLRSEGQDLSRKLVWLHVLHAAVVVAGLITVLSLLWNRLVLSRLQLLLSHINWMGRGAWTKTIAVRNNDEIGQLTRAFNQLGAELTRAVHQNTATAKLAALALLGHGIVRTASTVHEQLCATAAAVRLRSAWDDDSKAVLESLEVAIHALERIPAEFEAEFDRQFRHYAVTPQATPDPGACGPPTAEPPSGQPGMRRAPDTTKHPHEAN